MKLSPPTKAARRLSRALHLREKRFRGDHDYCTRVARCPPGFRVTAYPTFIEPGIPLGMSQKDLLTGEFVHVFAEPLMWKLGEDDQIVGPFAADGSAVCPHSIPNCICLQPDATPHAHGQPDRRIIGFDLLPNQEARAVAAKLLQANIIEPKSR
jgi:hypothetical protein